MLFVRILLSLCGLALVSSSNPVLADECSTIKSQMLANMSAINAQTAQMQRQIAALRRLETQRSCTPEKAALWGFFNACRNLARQRSQVEGDLEAARASARSVSLETRYEALGCDSVEQSREPELTRGRAPNGAKGLGSYTGNAIYYCVRPSDGYHFPAPNSQFGGQNYAKLAIEQCRFICEDAAMTVYALENPAAEISTMLSVETRKPYRTHPAAYRYLTNADRKACNWARYFARIDKLSAPAVSPSDTASADISTPSPRPENIVPPGSVLEEATRRESSDQAVRIVGPVFLQDGEGELRAKAQLDKER